MERKCKHGRTRKMIFVTVGTHEQPFNRLVEYMDKWAMKNDEKVVIQTGFSTYEPKNCEWSKLYPYQEIIRKVEKARIIITHGGPSSFIMPIQMGKVPIVVPRRKAFNEHVNDHQVNFSRAVSKRQKNIIVIEDIENLGDIIDKYDEIVRITKNGLQSNNKKFCSEFEKIVREILPKEREKRK